MSEQGRRIVHRWKRYWREHGTEKNGRRLNPIVRFPAEANADGRTGLLTGSVRVQDILPTLEA